jgi:hypothetical protein
LLFWLWQNILSHNVLDANNTNGAMLILALYALMVTFHSIQLQQELKLLNVSVMNVQMAVQKITGVVGDIVFHALMELQDLKLQL